MTAEPQPRDAEPRVDRAEPDDGPPVAERVVSDVETLKALSDPLRLRILETMASRTGEPWTVKELAAVLAVPQTRLYHHVEQLVDRDLIRLASQRVVSGIIESRYRVSALSFRLDRRLLSGTPEAAAAGSQVLDTVFDSARDELGRAFREYLSRAATVPASPDVPDAAAFAEAADADDPEKPLLSRGLAMLSVEQAAEFRERLLALMAEYDSDANAPDAVPWGFLIALYRVPPGLKEIGHD